MDGRERGERLSHTLGTRGAAGLLDLERDVALHEANLSLAQRKGLRRARLQLTSLEGALRLRDVRAELGLLAAQVGLELGQLLLPLVELVPAKLGVDLGSGLAQLELRLAFLEVA